jgi:sortase A
MSSRRRGTVRVVLGVLLLAAALCLAGYNLWDSHRAANAADQAATELMDQIAAQPAGPTEQLPAVYVDGGDYMGLLEIPSLGLTLPVMADWDYARLRVSPCRFSGSCEGNNLVICAHNYPSHFGPIRNVDIGADVYLTTADSRAHHYVVANREILAPTDVEKMADREQGDWDLTLFTCTLGGRTRCAVRCIRADA